MSDTTITAEERDLWASTAAARINAVTPERQCEITAQERLVSALKALEQAEAMVDWLANQAADICADAYPKSEVLRWWEDSNWAEAARRAVAESEVKG